MAAQPFTDCSRSTDRIRVHCDIFWDYAGWSEEHILAISHGYETPESPPKLSSHGRCCLVICDALLIADCLSVVCKVLMNKSSGVSKSLIAEAVEDVARLSEGRS